MMTGKRKGGPGRDLLFDASAQKRYDITDHLSSDSICHQITSDISYIPAGFPARNLAASIAPLPKMALE